MADRIQHRRDTGARWASVNPILLEGEIGYVIDNPNQYKIGDGVHAWNELPLRGFNGTISQQTGDDENAVISQKVVTEKLNEMQDDTNIKVEELHSRADVLQSTKASKDELSAESNRAKLAEQELSGRVELKASKVELQSETNRSLKAEQALDLKISEEAVRAKEVEEEQRGDFEANKFGFNVTVYGEHGGVHNLLSAIKDMPKKYRMLGQKITFRTENGDWATYHNESLSLANYENTKDWVQEVGVKEVTGDVNIENAPDYEDLTEAGNGTIKFADKEYSKSSFSGLGRIYLRKNIVNGVNILSQDMMLRENTRYIIQYDYDLNGATIEVPEGCVLDFQGGSLSNGTINIGNSIIEAGQYKIFDNISFAKVAEHIEGNPIWFGAVGDGATDDTAAVQRCVDSFKTTVLNGDTFSISSVWVEEVGHTVGRSIINRAKIISKGDGIALNHHCKFEGGRIFVLANSTGITIGREDDREDHNRMSVKDVLIISTGENRNKNNYGIKCVAKSEGTHYNAFCTFSGVKIYGCEHGFYGNIRSSYINVELEGCYENFNGTNCSLNNIIIEGNASDASENYPYFINIKGNLNTITPNVYDVGASGFQKKLINVDGYKNNILNSSQTIVNSDVTNTFSNPYYVNGLLHIKNPTYSVVFNNVEERDDIKKDVFDEKHNINATLWLVDSSKEGYIEFQFGRVFGFVGAEFLHKFSNDVFPKVEVRRNSTDEAPFLSITNKGYAPYTSIYSNTYKDFYNYNDSYIPQWNENLSIRCYVKNGSNVLGAKFYAQQASSYTPVGLLGDAPSNVKDGEQYFATDIKEDKHSDGTMLMFKGGKMFDANGFGINKIKKVFEKFHSAVGKYQFVKIVMDCQNPFNTYIPIQFFNAGETIKFFYTQFVIGVYGSPSNLKFTVSKVSTDSETLKCYLYSKVVDGKLNLIIAFDRISGYYSHLSIDRVITNQSSYEMYTISENEDTSDYTESVFYLFEKYMTQGTRAGYVASNGECVFDRTLNMPLWWDGGKWVKYNGLDVSVNSTGPFNYKPSSSLIKTGFAYFCTDRSTQEGGENGIMIYYKGDDVWVDALGRQIT